MAETKARKELRQAVSTFSAEYRSVLRVAEEKVLKNLNKGWSASKSVSAVMGREAYASEELKSALQKAILSAVKVGYGKNLSPAAQERAVVKLMETAWTRDSVTLDTRVTTLANSIREQVQTTIAATLSQTASVERLGRSLYKYVLSSKNPDIGAIRGLCRKIKTAARLATHGDISATHDLTTALDTLVRRVENGEVHKYQTAHNDVRRYTDSIRRVAVPIATRVAFEEKARYKAERLARTEASKAWFDGFIARYQGNDKVFGYRWLLSPRHRIYDQCDVCANISIGYGKGVYPKNNVPSIPRHPHCMCMLRPVYWSQVSPRAHLDISKARTYINSISQAKAQALFGINGAESVRAGGEWQTYLRGWNGFAVPISRLTANELNEGNE